MILFNKLIPERKNIRVRSGSTGATDTSSHDIIHGRQLCLHSPIVCDALDCATFTYFCLGLFFFGNPSLWLQSVGTVTLTHFMSYISFNLQRKWNKVKL